MSRRFGCVLLALAFGVCGFLRAERYHVRTYTEGDGLPSSSVRAIAQDASGRIWFATRTGITVYDGGEWQSYGAADGLVPADRRLLALDARGTAWAARSQGVEVAYLDDQRWIGLPQPDGTHGCYARDLATPPASGEPERVAVATSCGLFLWDDKRWITAHNRSGDGFDLVYDLLWTGDRLWAATAAGLAYHDLFAGRIVPVDLGLPPGPVFGLAHDLADPSSPRLAWASGENWLARIGADGAVTLTAPVEIAGAESPHQLSSDGYGGLLFGTHLSLYRYDGAGKPELLDEKSGLIAGGVDDIFVDRERNVWAAGPRGVSKIVSFRFATHGVEHGLFDDEVSAVLELDDGRMLLGHRAGLTFVDPDGGTRALPLPGAERVAPGLVRVLELARQRSGQVWIAGNRLGLGRMVGDDVSWSRPGKALDVTSVIVDDQDRLWVASGRDVFRGDGESLEALPQPFFETTHGMRRLVDAGDGAIWGLASGAGLFRFETGSWSHWQAPDRLEHNDLYSLLDRDEESPWVGSSGGLVEVRDGILQPVSQPAIDRPVYFIVADADGRFWFGTDNGVLRWDGEQLDRFTVEEGLAGRETNRAAGRVDRRGRVWIGTTHGVTVYHGALDRPPPVPPRVDIVGLEAAGERVALDGPLRLPWRSNDLVFSFHAVSFIDEQSVRLRSRLEGYESDWSEAAPEGAREIRYTNLPPGRYRFQVRAGNSAGMWSEIVAFPTVRIAAPLWGRAEFWVVAVALLGGAVWLVSRQVYQNRYTRTLEAEVQQRVAQLHRAEAELAKAQRLEALGLLAGGIAHDFNNLLTVVLGNLALIATKVGKESDRWLREAGTAVERARELTGQLLTFARGGAPVLNPSRIDECIRESATFVMSGSNVQLELDLPANLSVVEIDQGQFHRVVQNLLLNAQQAMPTGGRVRIVARNTDGAPEPLGRGRFVAIDVEDDGPGIDPERLPHVFDPYFSTKKGGSGLGLATAYSIVRRHDGLLTVNRPAGGGTRFTIYLPVSRQSAADPPQPSPAPAMFEGLRVLVMDDEPAVRDVIEATLCSLKCEVVTAADGAEAIELFREAQLRDTRFDLVMLDLTVPGGLGGKEVIGQLRRLDPEVRAIVASGYSQANVVSDYQSYGFKASLRKPFGRDDVARALEQALAT